MIKRNVLKMLLCLAISLITVVTVGYANGLTDGYDITNNIQRQNDGGTIPSEPSGRYSLKENYMYGNKAYPLVGLTEYGPVFLDTTSCTYWIDSGVAYVSCLVYYGSGGADGHGNAAKHNGVIIKLDTYKANDGRHIRFIRSTDNKSGVNNTNTIYRSDNGFLRSLFWKVSYRTGLSQYLD